MTTVGRPSIGAPPAARDDWDAIDWRNVFREVRRLQMRIAKAVREGPVGADTGPPGQDHPWPLKGLSRVRGNSHARFLGERGAGNGPRLPGGRPGTMKEKKRRELTHVSRLRQHFPDFPPGTIEPFEEPDALVRARSTIIGIEVTELHQEDQEGSPPRRGQEAERESIVRTARQLAEAGGVPIVDVHVHFSPHVSVAKRERRALARELAAAVSDNVPAEGETNVLENRFGLGPLAECFHVVRIYRSRVLTQHHWSVPDAGYVQADFASELQAAINQKVPSYDRYRTHCNACWLLVVASGQHPSSFFQASESTRTHRYASRFDRTIFMEGISGKCVELEVQSNRGAA